VRLDLNPKFDSTLLSGIEDAGLNVSAPPQQRWIDGWLVRFSPGKAKRARCINAVALGRLPITQRLTVCRKIYSEARLPLIVRVTPFSLPEDLDGRLDELGLQRFDDTRVMVLAELPAKGSAPLTSKPTFHPIGIETFAQRVGAFRGSPLAHRQAHAERLSNAPVPFFAFEMRADGEAVACGQFALDGELAGLYDIFTAESARERGFATALCRHLIDQARVRGARHAYLQVEGDNHDARSVYEKLGFADGYAYHYRTADPSAA
jgi:GNAT superfamily N-acetyltransferase